jgi:dTMP kinase
MSAGLLIVLEGAEGAGKSTQAARLAKHLAAARREHILLREPGGTPVGEEIRNFLLDPSNVMAAEAECLLFLASRAELVGRVLEPALAERCVVILDRFFLSTYAYQIWGRGLSAVGVRAANALATRGVKPDLTLLLTIRSETGMARAARRGAQDRMELTGSEFHTRVSNAFSLFGTAAWQSEHPECGEIVSVDADRREEEVFAGMLKVLQQRFPQWIPAT